MSRLHTYLWRNAPDANFGYFLLRVFTGIGLLTHGIPKLAAGPDRWAGIGQVVTNIGFPGPAVFWGFMAAFAESFGAALLIVGLMTRASAFLIAVTMAVAAFVAHGNDPFAGREMALLYLFISLMFMLKGAGSYAVDRFLPQN